MKMAAREMNLLFATLAVVLLAGTYLALEPAFQEWAEFSGREEELTSRRDAARHLLDSREAVEARLGEFRRGLPVYPVGRKVEADLLLGLERMAGQHELVLTRREADAEREAGDLYETAITCYWEGDLPALVHFLHAQQSQGAVSDVRQLSVQPSTGRGEAPGRLRGTFTMDFAYRREAGATDSPPAAAEPASAEGEAQPQRTAP